MKDEFISIIIPVYNVKEYLKRCVDSVLNQSYKNIEVILIDDGSTDGSEKICDEYAKKDKRVVVVHQKNSGVSASRNKGIELATGKYLSFIDADDYVSENYIFDLYRNIDNSIGLIISNAKDVVEDKIIDYNSVKKDIIISSIEAKKELFIGKKFSMVCWGNLYLTSIAKKVSFDKKMKIAEDFDFLYKYLELIDKVKIIKECNYFYLIRVGSAINSGFNENWIIQMNYFKSLIDSKNDYNLKKIKIIRFVKETVNCSVRNKINGDLKKDLKKNVIKYSFLYLVSRYTSIKDKIKFLYFCIF